MVGAGISGASPENKAFISHGFPEWLLRGCNVVPSCPVELPPWYIRYPVPDSIGGSGGIIDS